MAEDNIVQSIKGCKPMSKRLIGRPKTRWKDDGLEDIKNMNVRNWNEVAQNRDSSKKVVEQVRTLNRFYALYKKKKKMKKKKKEEEDKDMKTHLKKKTFL
jgi:hypothetical protein